jgi:hypothetical protein
MKLNTLNCPKTYKGLLSSKSQLYYYECIKLSEKGTNPSVVMEIQAFMQKLYQEFLSRKRGINMQKKANQNYGT